MNIGAIREGLAARLATVSGLHVVPRITDSVNPPVAAIANTGGSYDDDFEGDVTVNLTVLLLASRASDAANGQKLLDEYLSTSGTKSIRAALDVDPTLAGAAQSTRMTGWQTETGQYTAGGIDYVGVEVLVEVLA